MGDDSNYNALDRFLHRLAFAGLGLQRNMGEMETLSAPKLRQIAVTRPVFITSLPRAGTTLVLEMLAGAPSFVTHTYRDMPFILCPLTWDRIARGFRKTAAPQERAHGDGMMVGFDSAEAFEDVLWKAFWPGKYRRDGIALWSSGDRNPEFEEFFRDHIRKLVLLRGVDAGRYISKNNANIARLTLLPAIFPDCDIVIPFRDPVDHAVSLLRQHHNFLALHRRDPFALRYMESIGHYEFGKALRPVKFPGEASSAPPDALAYWLDYWVRAFAWVLEMAGSHATFLDYDRLAADPAPVIGALTQRLGLRSGALPGRVIHPANRYPADGAPSKLLEKARDLHARMASRAL